jgi:endonuclease/exonuclease/phosphatase family metal-dependent hydrolase
MTRRYTASALLLATLATLAGCGDDSVVTVEEPPPPGPAVPFTVMTFNVLCSFCGVGEYDSWDDRLPAFDDLFARYDPDLLGLQELAFDFEVDQVLAMLPGYEALYYKNAEGFEYPDATIVFRSERFEVVSRGEYWLSPTPDVPSSSGFAENGQLPRLLSWAELKDRASGRSLYFASTHFDNNSPSQEMSAPIVIERTAPFAEKMPAVVLGDFNSKPADTAFTILTEGSGFTLADTQPLAASFTVASNQATEPAYDLDARIDHIFVAPDAERWAVESWTADHFVYGPNLRYPSDHRALIARVLAPEM